MNGANRNLKVYDRPMTSPMSDDLFIQEDILTRMKENVKEISAKEKCKEETLIQDPF